MPEDVDKSREVAGKANADHALAVDADPTTRKGVHSNIVMATSRNNVTQLDFILDDTVDGPDETTRGGVLSARVFMSSSDLLSLRDMLIKHTKEWKIDNGNVKDA